jgi:hypothetical protein
MKVEGAIVLQLDVRYLFVFHLPIANMLTCVASFRFRPHAIGSRTVFHDCRSVKCYHSIYGLRWVIARLLQEISRRLFNLGRNQA